MKLLVLADDLTGALDTGIQFVRGNANTRVVLDANYPLAKIDDTVQVLVIDTESRHLPAQQAAVIIRNIVKQAGVLKVPYIYKKTDSALRGNVGAELTAALEASHAEQLQFIPAFPKTKRTTVNGIQLIDGVPVAESVFGKDPFDPIKHSPVAEILKEQTTVDIQSIPLDAQEADTRGIVVYDASTEEDILKRAKNLKEKNKLGLLAGCAGFASVLSGLIHLSGAEKNIPQYSSSFLVACGSVNPITIAQLKEAESYGFQHFYITPKQALTKDWFKTKEGKDLLDHWAELLKKGQNCIIDTNAAPGTEKACDYGPKHNLTLDDLRIKIAETMGYVLQELLAKGVDSTMLITGGDTLMGFMKKMGIAEIVPIEELITGSVLSIITIKGKKYNIISKSGGFGNKMLIADLAKLVLPKK